MNANFTKIDLPAFAIADLPTGEKMEFGGKMVEKRKVWLQDDTEESRSYTTVIFVDGSRVSGPDHAARVIHGVS